MTILQVRKFLGNDSSGGEIIRKIFSQFWGDDSSGGKFGVTNLQVGKSRLTIL